MSSSTPLGGHSTAKRRAGIVVAAAFAAMVLYMKIGGIQWSIAIAEKVPGWGKWCTLVAFLALVWLSDQAIQRRVLHPALPKPRIALFILAAMSGLAFAIVTADSRTLFYIGTFAWISFLCASSFYYRQRPANQTAPKRS
jgi:hypothetical protein